MSKKPIAKNRITIPKTQKAFLALVPSFMVPPKWMDNPEAQTVIKQKFVHQWLFNKWTITSAQAWAKFGITRLADVIFKMRKKGVRIRSMKTFGKDRFNKPTRFATYKYISGKRKFLKLQRKAR